MGSQVSVDAPEKGRHAEAKQTVYKTNHGEEVLREELVFVQQENGALLQESRCAAQAHVIESIPKHVIHLMFLLFVQFAKHSFKVHWLFTLNVYVWWLVGSVVFLSTWPAGCTWWGVDVFVVVVFVFFFFFKIGKRSEECIIH
jgi:hypothetical protein